MDAQREHSDKRDVATNSGEASVKRQRSKRRKLLLIELFQDYTKNCSLHGLKYVCESGRSVVEKIFWVLTFLLSTSMCFLLMRNVWIKWQTSPVIVSFNEHIVPVSKVPFPSVTICPQRKSVPSKYNFSREYQKVLTIRENTNDDEYSDEMIESMAMLDDVALLCNQGLYEPALANRTTTNSTTMKRLYHVSPVLADVTFGCTWRNSQDNCDDLFTTVVTSEGVCFNFNALAAEEIFQMKNIQQDYLYLATKTPSKWWSLIDGYSDYYADAYPRRGMENGASPDLEILLTEPLNQSDALCNSLNKGYKIYVQHPADMPQASLYYYAALPKQVSSLALKFTMLTTADSLKDYSPEVRQCYFPSDRSLRYFKIYTANNCRLECQSNVTYQKCGCVWFHMPHSDGMPICTDNMRSCVASALDDLSIEEIKAEKDPESSACRCFPDCHSVYYDAEILKTEFDVETYLSTISKIHKVETIEPGTQFSRIEMYFKEPRFISMRRSELFGLTDFLANCGGLLGLFLGFSFLSLVEIIYFVTLRLCYDLKQDLKKEKANSKKSLEELSFIGG